MTNRQTIFRAAIEVFSERGFAEVSLQQIAERAGCETASVRALFIDTNTLLRELVEEVSTPLLSAISIAVEKHDSPRAMLKESMRLLDNWLTENPQYVRVFQRCSLDDPGAVGIIYQKAMYPSEYYERIDAWIKEGRIRAKDTFSLVLMLDAAIITPHFWMPFLTRAASQSQEEVLQSRSDTLWEAFEHGLFAD
ncbi:MAG: TetR/AcrR family transcriptional regulator [bacterium]|nr:TetR/AcrR family transcriptional regulator [bacterium]